MPVVLLAAILAIFLVSTSAKAAPASGPAPRPTPPPPAPRRPAPRPPVRPPSPPHQTTPTTPARPAPKPAPTTRPPKPAPQPHFSGTVRKSDVTTFNIVNRVVQQMPAMIQDEISYKMGRRIPMTIIAMATMMASEESKAPSKIAVGWAAMNYMIHTGKGLGPILMPDGRFAAQNVKGHGYASTARPPNKADILLAEKVILKRMKDPTGGSIQFDSPKAQRQLVARGAPGYSHSPEAVAAQRRKEGKVEIHVADISPDDLRFWRPVA